MTTSFQKVNLLLEAHDGKIGLKKVKTIASNHVMLHKILQSN